MNRSFWANKSVFLTGHTGFKGSWLALWLQRLGARVTGYSLAPPTEPSLYKLAHIDASMTSIEADVRDLGRLQDAIRKCRPDIVIHMAAQALVRQSYADPVDNYATNLMGTVNILEAIRQSEGVRVFLNITSDKCYENREWLWAYRENEPLGGYDPYSSSKACAELITAAYRNSFFSGKALGRGQQVVVATARAGNVIGGGDWAKDRLIPDIVKSILQGQPVVIRNPGAIRPWQHVLEPLSGYMLLVEKMWNEGAPYAQAWNFGPDNNANKPVSDILAELFKYWGQGEYQIDSTGSQPHEAHYLQLDSSKSRSLLGWSPRLTLSQALEWVVEWYQGYQVGQDMRRLTEEQIARYEQA